MKAKLPTAERRRYTYGVTIRPTSRDNRLRIKENPERLGILYMQLCLNAKLQSEGDWVIENNNHLHATVTAEALNYNKIKRDNPGWHIYMRKKRGVELKVWKAYLEKEKLIYDQMEYIKHEYAFID